MKKTILLLLACCFVLSGCGEPTVPQEEYDSVVAERDELESRIESLENAIELCEKAAEYQARMEEQYKHAKFVLFVMGEIAGIDTSDLALKTEDLYRSTTDSIGTVKNVYENIDALEGADELIDDTTQAIDDLWEAWSGFYDTVLNMETFITE